MREEREVIEAPDQQAIALEVRHWDETPLPQGGLSMLVLRNVGAPRVPVNRWRFTRGETNATDLAAKIASDALHDADQLSGFRQQYTLEAIFGDDRAPSAQKRITAHVRGDDDVLSHGPSNGGSDKDIRLHAADAMNFALKMGKQGLSTLAGMQARITYLETRNQALETELDDAKEAIDAAQDKTAERARAARNHEELLRYCAELFQIAKTFLPVMASLASKGKIPMPEWANPLVEQFQNLYNAITSKPEVMTAVLKALSESQEAMAAFSGIMLSIEDPRLLAEQRAKVAVEAETKATELARKNGTPQKKAMGFGVLDLIKHGLAG